MRTQKFQILYDHPEYTRAATSIHLMMIFRGRLLAEQVIHRPMGPEISRIYIKEGRSFFARLKGLLFKTYVCESHVPIGFGKSTVRAIECTSMNDVFRFFGVHREARSLYASAGLAKEST